MQRSAFNDTLPSKESQQRGFKSKASRYFIRTPSFASFKSAPATTDPATGSSQTSITDKGNTRFSKARRSVSFLAARLPFFKRKMLAT